MNMRLENRIAELLFKSVRDELTDCEAEELAAWRAAAPEHELFYQRVQQEEYIERELALRLRGERRNGELWLRVRRDTVGRRQMRRRWMYGGVAACLGLLAGITLLLRPGVKEASLQMAERVIPGTYKALLFVGNECVELSDSARLAITADVWTEGGRLEYRSGNETGAAREMHTLQVPRGGEYGLRLADGTKVFLNAESELRYPAAFDGTCREVALKGEAFFEVAADSAKPFIVRVDGMQVRVLGTSFNINAYHPSCVETALVSGRVAVGVEDSGEEWTMQPSDLLRFDRESGEVTVTQTDLWPYIAWKEGEFLFRNRSVEEIMEILARWYDIEVEYRDEAVKQFHFTGDIRRRADVRVILNALTANVPVAYLLQQRKVILYHQ